MPHLFLNRLGANGGDLTILHWLLGERQEQIYLDSGQASVEA